MRIGDYDKAEEYELHALDIRERIFGGQHQDCLNDNCRDHIDFHPHDIRNNHPEIALSLEALAAIYSRQGRIADADTARMQAAEIFKATLGCTSKQYNKLRGYVDILQLQQHGHEQ